MITSRLHRRKKFKFWKVLLVVLIFVGGYFAWRNFIYLPSQLEISAEAGEIEFVIEKGESIDSIAERLFAEGLIKNEWAFKEYLANTGFDKTIQAGWFHFAGDETIPQVAQALQSGGVQEIKLTILEGWNSSDIDEFLTEKGLIESGDFSTFIREGGGEQPEWAAERPVASLEGYIFPATYRVDPVNFSVENFTQKMLDAMEVNLAAAGWDEVARSRRSLHEVLTMASIVELEENDPANQPLVADILWRRLDNGWQLGADATLFYVLGHQKNLTSEDLAADNPYNTRVKRGLPPTPIASPGLASLQAAISPESNNFWFYLHGSDGAVHFAETNDEHNQNRAEFL